MIMKTVFNDRSDNRLRTPRLPLSSALFSGFSEQANLEIAQAIAFFVEQAAKLGPTAMAVAGQCQCRYFNHDLHGTGMI